MSPQVIAEPEDPERFASELNHFNAQLADSLSRLNGQFARLGETWRDQEHAKFADEYQETARVLHHFMRSSEEQIPFLLRKARRLRDFLHQR